MAARRAFRQPKAKKVSAFFEIVGAILDQETIAAGGSIREVARLRKRRLAQTQGHRYVTLVDHEAERVGMVRVVDESGEDYLYPRTFFAPIKISPHLAKTLASAT